MEEIIPSEDITFLQDCSPRSCHLEVVDDKCCGEGRSSLVNSEFVVVLVPNSPLVKVLVGGMGIDGEGVAKGIGLGVYGRVA